MINNLQTVCRRVKCAWCAGLFVFASVLSSGSEAAMFVPLDNLLGDNGFSIADGISADGRVVVGHTGDKSSLNSYQLFRWTSEGGMEGLGQSPRNPPRTSAEAVSGDGSSIVGMGHLTNYYWWTEDGGYVDLAAYVPTTYVTVEDITDDGVIIVGTEYRDGAGSAAYRMTADGDYSSINSPYYVFASGANAVSADGATVAGGILVSSGQLAARWTENTGWLSLGDLAGGNINGNSSDITPDGSIIVGRSSSAFGTQAFRWTEETGMIGLGFLSSDDPSSSASAVSADGSIVVGRSTEGGDNRAFIWTADQGMRSLESVLVDTYGLDMTGWHLYEATDISADGTRIVGTGYNPQGVNTAFLVTIPEPGTVVMFGLCVSGVAVRRR